MSILIFAVDEDQSYLFVKSKIEERGFECRSYSFYDYPHACTLAYNYLTDDIIFDKGNEVFSSNEITAVWSRSLTHNFTHQYSLPNDEKFVKLHSNELFSSLPYLMPNAYWLNRNGRRLAKHKTYQLMIAKQAGFSLPEGIIGNSYAALDALAKNHDTLAIKPIIHHEFIKTKLKIHPKKAINHLIKKTLHTLNLASLPKDEPWWSISEEFTAYYTKKFPSSQLVDAQEAIEKCPTIIQSYIPKKLELRVTVVGQDIFACAIHSQSHAASSDDFRALPDYYKEMKHEPYDLPDNIKQQCLALMRLMQLDFGAIDIILTPDDEYVFLEINQSGQWMWVQNQTGLMIGEAIAELLIAKSKTN
jgi:hypothetical protein